MLSISINMGLDGDSGGLEIMFPDFYPHAIEGKNFLSYLTQRTIKRQGWDQRTLNYLEFFKIKFVLTKEE